MPVGYVDTIGRYGEGNIDLNNRIVVHNEDGSISTERSFSTNIDGMEVLLPTVIYGEIWDEEDAIDHYFDTGEYLGIFSTVEAAEDYAERLHERQEWYYTVGVFNGKLLEFSIGGGYTEFPIKYIKSESYKVTPDQRLETEAGRAVTGYLHRTTAEHMPAKIDMTTIPLTNDDVKTINVLLANAFTDSAQRKLDLRYYEPSSDSYKTGTFYMPDIDYDIQRVDLVNNVIYYKPTRLAFIEY